MKKQTKRLGLDLETITRLQPARLEHVVGGLGPSGDFPFRFRSCNTCTTNVSLPPVTP